MGKLKVALICHFSNQNVRDELPLAKLGVRNKIRSLFGKPPIQVNKDYAPWVTSLIQEFEKLGNLEVHVIAPHIGLTHLTHEFIKNGVHYHFYKSDLFYLYDTLRRKMPFRYEPKYRMNRFLVKRFIKRIKPDIVDLIGAENPFYSITALDVDDVPLYLSLQTVYTNPARLRHSGQCDPFRWDLEMQIHKKIVYYGCSGRMHRDLILKNRPDAVILKANFIRIQPALFSDAIKTFDFAFFAAHVCTGKGIEDALRALAKVKAFKTDVSLDVVGNCSPEYKAIITRLIEEMNLRENVSFHGYFALQSDMFRHIQQARFAILPIKLDVIPGTVVESMFLELPVVTYKTSGTPYLNKNAPCVLLAEIGDIDTLAQQMLKLLDSPSLADALKRNAKAFAVKEYDSAACARRIASNYQAVINHYHRHVPLPEELLFDIKEFPVYQGG